MLSTEELIELAAQARANAYAPYSNFHVGAAVECRDGRVFTGCNVENSSYGLTICAEQVALTKAISEGARDFARLAVIADAHAPVPPCGACRQLIAELCAAETEIITANVLGRRQTHTISDLLPTAFDQSFL